jgi:hypothetical protein
VGERLVAIRTVDGKLHGISIKDGQELWTQEQQVPRLSLRGTSWPVLTGDLVLSGFDNGKVAAVNVNDGSVQWETTISPPHGKTELERLDDVDAAVRVSGSDVYAIGFQGRVAMLALDTGQIWWSHDASSFRGLGLDDESLYVATADGEIMALRRRTGTELWRQKGLLHRRLSAVVEADTSVVAGDYQGYVHWLDKATGALAARASTGKKVRISNPPVVAGNLVLVVNDAGRISAFRTSRIAGKTSARPAAPSTPQGAAAEPPTEVPQAAPSGSGAATPAPGAPAPESTPPAGEPAPPAEPAPAAPESMPPPSDAAPPAPGAPEPSAGAESSAPAPPASDSTPPPPPPPQTESPPPPRP